VEAASGDCGLEFANDLTIFADEESGEDGGDMQGHIGEGSVVGDAIVNVLADESH
jgi:hypothetical protein